jgi:hypothetical protein
VSRIGSTALALLLLAALPELGHACPVCFDAGDENRRAFIATTAFLTLLPLGMVVGTGLWLRRRARRMDADGRSEPSGH